MTQLEMPYLTRVFSQTDTDFAAVSSVTSEMNTISQ